VPVRGAAHDGTLRQGDAAARHVAERWEQFIQYLCLSFSQELGRNVISPRPRKQTTSDRLDEVAKSLATLGTLQATIRVPDAIGDLSVRADLKSRQTSFSVDVGAPTEGRPKSRINWLLRQLTEAWPDLRIEVWYPHARESVAATVEQAREQPEGLLCPGDVKRDPRSFVLTLTRLMGQKRGRSEGSFVRETRAQAVTFYRDLVQNLKAWQVRAPQIRAEPSPVESDPSAPPDLLPPPPDDRMLPRTTNGDLPDVDATDPSVSSPEQSRLLQDSAQGSVLSEADSGQSDNPSSHRQPDPTRISHSATGHMSLRTALRTPSRRFRRLC
jgi:hypothetical protein